jgi:hypothetical protein
VVVYDISCSTRDQRWPMVCGERDFLMDADE